MLNDLEKLKDALNKGNTSAANDILSKLKVWIALKKSGPFVWEYTLTDPDYHDSSTRTVHAYCAGQRE